MNDDRRSILDQVRGRIDWIDGSIKEDRLSNSDLFDVYLDDLEYARMIVQFILSDEEESFDHMPEGFQWGPNGCESMQAQKDLKEALKALDTLISKVNKFKEKYLGKLFREYDDGIAEERYEISVKLRRLMKRYISRTIEHLRPYSLNLF